MAVQDYKCGSDSAYYNANASVDSRYSSHHTMSDDVVSVSALRNTPNPKLVLETYLKDLTLRLIYKQSTRLIVLKSRY